MSALVRGVISDTNLSRNAKGGTEQMRSRLLRVVDETLLKKVSIHLSRVRPENIIKDGPNVLWCHDLVGDPESQLLANNGYKQFDKLVFVSYWQRDQFIQAYNIPYSHCTVIENAIEKEYTPVLKPENTINFIYHTTPHRGLGILYHVFDALSKTHSNIHLDVYSSFGVYGWKERDAQFQPLFNAIKKHPKMTYHGAKSNQDVMVALEKTHIFLYPCIWPETSCIALIEAKKSGVLSIHPTLAALPETADGHTIMYDYTEDMHEHARRALGVTEHILKTKPSPYGYIGNQNIPGYDIKTFGDKWTALLTQLTK